MENANKFKVVKDITVLDCSTPYMFERTKKHIADKYKGLGIADDAMLAKLWKNVEVNYAQLKYPTVIDFDLIKYDTETVNAAFEELGVLFGKFLCKKVEVLSTNFLKKVDQLPVFTGYWNNLADYYSLEILANYDRGSKKGTTLYTSIGWCDSRKDEEVAEETLQQGKPFFWSFINWVKNYIGNALNTFQSKLEQGVPAATLTQKGAVKMAGKVDALADSATLVQTVQQLNTLIANLKSAGIMSEN